MTILILVLVVVAFIAADALRIYLKKKPKQGTELFRFMPFRKPATPLGIFFDPSHVWVRLNDSGEFRVGFDELVLQGIKVIDRIDTVPAGTPVKRGDKIAAIVAGERKYILKSPVSGTVITSNYMNREEASSLYEDPYFSGWLIKIWPKDTKESLKSLMIGKAAEKWMEREIQRFSDFLASHATPALGPALADGAKPIMGALLFLDDRGWKEFEEEFLKLPPC